MAASENILCFFKERAATSERYQCATAFDCNVRRLFLCVAASGNISMFFN